MSAAAAAAARPLSGTSLIFGTLALSLATFMNVVDTSIANVSLPAIAGNLGASPNQGTWTRLGRTATGERATGRGTRSRSARLSMPQTPEPVRPARDRRRAFKPWKAC
jgi:hypothetical protein